MTVPRHDPPTSRPAVLEARDLELTFSRTAALRGASVDVKSGEVVAVLGPSGSGKSTLLHCLAGILAPDSGEVLYQGERLDHLADARRSRLRREHFGFVFQFGQPVPTPQVVVVLVTHEPRVAAYADREVVVRDGRVVEYAGVSA